MKLTTRQKVLIPIIIIAFLYIGWQLYDMLASPTPTPIPARPVATVPQQTSTSAVAQQPSTQVPTKKPIATLLDGQQTKTQGPTYSKLMTKYRTLQAKRMLLQEQLAIAEAQKKIAGLNVQVSQAVGPSATATLNGSIPSSQQLMPYRLVYLDFQDGQWSASLTYKGRTIEAKRGMLLPDSSRVLSINSRGALINYNNKIIKLTFNGPIVIRHSKKIAKSPATIKKIAPVKKTVIDKSLLVGLAKTPNITRKPKPIIKPDFAVKPTATTPKKTVKKPKIIIKKVSKPKPIKANFTVQTVGSKPPAKVTPPAKPKPLQPTFTIKKASAPKPVITTKPIIKAKPVTVAKPKPITTNFSIQPSGTSTHISNNVVPVKKPAVAKPNFTITTAKKPPVVTKPKVITPNFSVTTSKPVVTVKKPVTTQPKPTVTKPKPITSNFKVERTPVTPDFQIKAMPNQATVVPKTATRTLTITPKTVTKKPRQVIHIAPKVIKKVVVKTVAKKPTVQQAPPVTVSFSPQDQTNNGLANPTNGAAN